MGPDSSNTTRSVRDEIKSIQWVSTQYGIVLYSLSNGVNITEDHG